MYKEDIDSHSLASLHQNHVRHLFPERKTTLSNANRFSNCSYYIKEPSTLRLPTIFEEGEFSKQSIFEYAISGAKYNMNTSKKVVERVMFLLWAHFVKFFNVVMKIRLEDINTWHEIAMENRLDLQ